MTVNPTFSDLLLLLAVTDLHESGDDEVGEYLEHLLGAIEDDLEDGLVSDGKRELCLALKERVLDQMEIMAPDRDQMTEWLLDCSELLPPAMDGFSEELDRFDELLEIVFDDEEVEELERVRRFLYCVDLLEQDEWMQRSEGAKGLGTLEEEMFVLRDDYLSVPVELEECDAQSVVTRMHTLDAFESWQKAFRYVHTKEFDEAVDSALEGACLFTAVERWTSERVGSRPS